MSHADLVHLALLLHLTGALLLVSGIVLAGVAFEAARRRRDPAEVALLLGLTRTGALLIGTGTLLVLAFGLWLTHLEDWPTGTGWIVSALGLLMVMVVLGGLGGRRPKQARKLAERGGDAAGVHRLLDDPASRAANYAAAACVVVILVLMVFKPTF